MLPLFALRPLRSAFWSFRLALPGSARPGHPGRRAPAPTAAVAQSDVDRFELARARKVRRDRTLRALSDGVLRMRKLTYRSRIGDLDVPFYLFEPLALRGDRGHAALIWIHGGRPRRFRSVLLPVHQGGGRPRLRRARARVPAAAPATAAATTRRSTTAATKSTIA